jgi:hypothetical protein
VPLLAPVARKMVEVTIDGVVRERAIPTAPFDRSSPTSSELRIAHSDLTVDRTTPPKDGQLVLAEELVEGHVTWNSFMLFLRAHAGSRPVFYTLLWTSLFVFSQFISVSKNWFLGYWGLQYERREPSEVRAPL